MHLIEHAISAKMKYSTLQFHFHQTQLHPVSHLTQSTVTKSNRSSVVYTKKDSALLTFTGRVPATISITSYLQFTKLLC